MAKYQHWYIRGWVYEDELSSNGTVRRVMKYRGEYYRPSLSERQFKDLKIVWTALLAATCGVYVWYSLHGSSGGREAYAGAGCILALIPLIFQAMGIFSLWSAPYRMPFRNYYAAILRTKVASAFTAALLGFSAAGEVVFIMLHRGQTGIVWADEWIWFSGCALCAAASLVMFWGLKRLHFDILPGEINTRSPKK